MNTIYRNDETYDFDFKITFRYGIVNVDGESITVKSGSVVNIPSGARYMIFIYNK